MSDNGKIFISTTLILTAMVIAMGIFSITTFADRSKQEIAQTETAEETSEAFSGKDDSDDPLLISTLVNTLRTMSLGNR